MNLDLDADLLLALLADGQLDRRDCKILDAVFNQGMSKRAAARHIGIVPGTVRLRLRRMRETFARIGTAATMPGAVL